MQSPLSERDPVPFHLYIGCVIGERNSRWYNTNNAPNPANNRSYKSQGSIKIESGSASGLLLSDPGGVGKSNEQGTTLD